jgi:hypothetical protein
MTNCAVTSAPKLSEKGAARSDSSSVNARTGGGRLTTVPEQEFERRGLRYPRLIVGMLGIQLGGHTPRNVGNSLCAGDVRVTSTSIGYMLATW